jgi:hypothetical protein
VAVAVDPTAATGTVGERGEEPERSHDGLPSQAAREVTAASSRTIGTSFRFSGSSRSSVRPRYMSLLRKLRKWSRYSIPACTSPYAVLRWASGDRRSVEERPDLGALLQDVLEDLV